MRTVSILLLIAVFTVSAFAADQPKKVYVCPMAEHTQEFDKPGSCPLCGMTLVEKEARFRVAVLVFNDAEDIDFTAPIEVLGHTGAQIFTVAATTEPVTTVFGLHIRPDYDLGHAPESSLVLVPGGGIGDTAKNERVLAWLRERAASSRYVMSVCNGAFILAKAGLLDGLTATTTAGHIDELAAAAPKTHVVRERLVDNGKVITTGGLSAGIDGALHVIERQWGRTRAEHIARGLEYRWDPNSKWTRATLADLRMPDFKLPDGAQWEELTSHGDTQQWKVSGLLHVAMAPDDFLDYATKEIAASGWTLRDHSSGKRSFVRDNGGQTWMATLLLSRGDASPALEGTMTVESLKR